MKIGLINGSPKGKSSSSYSLLDGLKKYLIDEEKELEIKEFIWNLPNSGEKDFKEIIKCDAIVFVFPLYVDSIPSHFLRNLVKLEDYIKKNKVNNKEVNVYTIVNNGFFEGKQNCLALDSIKYFCNHTKLRFMQGIGVGGGGMLSGIEKVPFGHGPKKKIGNSLIEMSTNIILKKEKEISFVEPNFPSFLYKFMAQRGWRNSLKKNGLKTSDINKRL